MLPVTSQIKTGSERFFFLDHTCPLIEKQQRHAKMPRRQQTLALDVCKLGDADLIVHGATVATMSATGHERRCEYVGITSGQLPTAADTALSGNGREGPRTDII